MTTSSRVPIKSGFACFFFSVSFPFFAKNPIMHQRDKSDSITLTKQVELISSLSLNHCSSFVTTQTFYCIYHEAFSLCQLLRKKHASNMICLNEMLKSVN